MSEMVRAHPFLKPAHGALKRDKTKPWAKPVEA